MILLRFSQLASAETKKVAVNPETRGGLIGYFNTPLQKSNLSLSISEN